MDYKREESIYNLIPKEPVKIEKPASQDNDHSPNGRSRGTRVSFKTMGPAKVPQRPPDQFLKSHENDVHLPKSQQRFKYADAEKRKPPVPKVTEKPVMGVQSNKNFIVENAIQNITAAPRVPERTFVDSRHGEKQPLDASGLYPVYLNKKDFGKTPIYLEKRKMELEQNEADMRAYVEMNERKNQMKRMTEDERNIIIKGLKDNWEYVYKDYLALPMVIDTPMKKSMKERMERDMEQLERDARLIESHKIIYIAD
ncbi:hypothetical protein HELRODRAFT_85777 [Helobdella robusta]|uniref:Enkurin domain-containing protein n=1 Tax=Helobdella robusta TaxID=6412 RepID=T1G627_HELRO|nr:hypothetical protein HELRODRAFT_85777 [Helobdella robusta]ESN97142.1 hypothetical protein HELRODRAFT_85777 [Helobdella robusta]